jgi:hypothetical protein
MRAKKRVGAYFISALLNWEVIRRGGGGGANRGNTLFQISKSLDLVFVFCINLYLINC